MKRFFGVLLVLCVAATVFGGGGAQGGSSTQGSATFPARPVEIVVPYAAGSGNDINCRTIAPFMEKYLGVAVVVSNEPAANGQVAMTRIARSGRADGYTISYANMIATGSLHVMGDFVVDPSTEFAHLGVITIDPGIIMTPKSGGVKTLADLVNAAKARPGQVTYGCDDLYSLDGLIMMDLESQAGIKFNPVNLGGAEVNSVVMGGHVESAGGSIVGSVTHYNDGALEIIGVGSDERAPELPNVPTFKEQGFNFTIQSAERTLFTRAGLPQEAYQVLCDAVEKASFDQGFIDACKKIGMRNYYIDPDTALEHMKGFMDFFRSIKPQA